MLKQNTIDLDEVWEELTTHINRTDNPHRIKLADLNLDKVDNTADIDKPVSTATQKLIDETNKKIDLINTELNKSISKLKKNNFLNSGEKEGGDNSGELTNIKIKLEELEKEIEKSGNTDSELKEKLKFIDSRLNTYISELGEKIDSIEEKESYLTESNYNLKNEFLKSENSIQNSLSKKTEDLKQKDFELQEKLSVEILERKQKTPTEIAVLQGKNTHNIVLALMNEEGEILSKSVIDMDTEHIVSSVSIDNNDPTKLILQFSDGHKIECSLELVLNQLKTEYIEKVKNLNYIYTSDSNFREGGPGKTLTKITQNEGLIEPIYSDIEIEIKQVLGLIDRLKSLEDSLKEFTEDKFKNLNKSFLNISSKNTIKTVTQVNGELELITQPIEIDTDQVKNLNEVLDDVKNDSIKYTDTVKKELTKDFSFINDDEGKTIKTYKKENGIVKMEYTPIKIRTSQIVDKITLDEVNLMLSEVFNTMGKE